MRHCTVKKAEMKKSKGLTNEGYGVEGEETPEKPYPREKFRKQRNEEKQEGKNKMREI